MEIDPAIREKIINLPPNSPDRFGEILKLLANNAMPKKYRSEVIYLSDKLYIDRSIVNSHIKGTYNSVAKKYLSEEHFQNYIFHFYNKENKFYTFEEKVQRAKEIIQLARCAGKNCFTSLLMDNRYRLLLDEEVFDNLIGNSSDFGFQENNIFVNRADIVSQILNCSEECKINGNKIILFGPDGSGKKTIIRKIESILRDNFSFHKTLIANFNSCPTKQDILRSWYYNVVGELPIFTISSQELESAKKQITYRLKEHSYLLVFTDIKTPSDIQIFPHNNLKGSLIIITTSSKQVVDTLVEENDQVINIEGFSDNQAVEFFQKLGWGNTSGDFKSIAKLNSLVNGIPYSLYYSFHYSKNNSLADCIEILEQGNPSDIENPDISEIYLPTNKIIEKLGLQNQRLFTKMGNIPRLASYDKLFFSYLINRSNPTSFIDALSNFGLLIKYNNKNYAIYQLTHNYLKYQYSLLKLPNSNNYLWVYDAIKSEYYKPFLITEEKKLFKNIYRAPNERWATKRISHFRKFIRDRNIKFFNLRSVMAEWNFYFPPSHLIQSNEFVLYYSIFRKFLIKNIVISFTEAIASLLFLNILFKLHEIIQTTNSLSILILSVVLVFSMIVCIICLLLYDKKILVNFLRFLDFVWQKTSTSDSMVEL